MGLILEALGQTESIVVGLKQAVSVLVLVQSGHGRVELLQASSQTLLGLRPDGQVGPQHAGQGNVVACICRLRRAERQA